MTEAEIHTKEPVEVEIREDVPMVRVHRCENCPVEPPTLKYREPNGKVVDKPECYLDEEDAEVIDRMIEYAVLHYVKLEVDGIEVPWQEIDGLIKVTDWKKALKDGSKMDMQTYRVAGGLEILRKFLEKTRKQEKQPKSTSKNRG